jgi:hypothetical protein
VTFHKSCAAAPDVTAAGASPFAQQRKSSCDSLLNAMGVDERERARERDAILETGTRREAQEEKAVAAREATKAAGAGDNAAATETSV